jgi:hypothetical protein
MFYISHMILPYSASQSADFLASVFVLLFPISSCI